LDHLTIDLLVIKVTRPSAVVTIVIVHHDSTQTVLNCGFVATRDSRRISRGEVLNRGLAAWRFGVGGASG